MCDLIQTRPAVIKLRQSGRDKCYRGLAPIKRGSDSSKFLVLVLAMAVLQNFQVCKGDISRCYWISLTLVYSTHVLIFELKR